MTSNEREVLSGIVKTVFSYLRIDCNKGEIHLNDYQYLFVFSESIKKTTLLSDKQLANCFRVMQLLQLDIAEYLSNKVRHVPTAREMLAELP